MKLIALAAPALLAACTVGPDYVKPNVATPAAFKETGNWKQARPRDLEERGEWWKVFNDPLLDSLEDEVSASSQNLAKAEAQYRQALALVQSARAGYFPTVTGGVSSMRSRSSATTTAQPSSTPVSRGAVTDHNMPFQASWAPDIWGNISRAVQANEANAQASEADLEAARLSAQATLAQSYFQLRSLDTQQLLLEDTVAAYGKALTLVQHQYAAGAVAKADLVQAQTQLKTAQAQAIDIGVQRAQFEHAIAVLIGKPASNFSIARGPLMAATPAVPVGLPSDLLERRPDIAAAERRMAQANAQIGIANAAYFPSLTLSATAGYESATLVDWLTAPSRFWSFGTAVAGTLFDGGLRRAQTDQAIAAYDSSVAVYRQTVLAGIQQVEDNLSALRILEQEAVVQDDAVRLANQSLALTINQYKAGAVNFLNVAVAQTTALANRRIAINLLGQRLVASTQLIANLGGGWSETEVPPRAAPIGRSEPRTGGNEHDANAGK